VPVAPNGAAVTPAFTSAAGQNSLLD
jgi:hypothetical protein